jgi:hypothetical protein
MYQVDEKDRIEILAGVPQSSVGAPLPFVIADEHRTILAYYMEDRPQEWDGSQIRVVDPISSNEPTALVQFQRCMVHMFGPPNDEAFSGHPLASRGVRPYGAFRVKNSSWIRQLERMNSVHKHHNPARFWELQHLVFAFHDSVFECVCQTFDTQEMRGAIHAVIPEMVKMLHWERTHI